MKTHTGFTLIELLVVVAIIGILAATILASLGGARGKAVGARAQSELSSMRAAAEIYYSTNGKYDNAMFTDTASGLDNLVKSITKVDPGFAPQADATTWAAQATIGGTAYCADSNGFSGKGTSSGGSPFVCTPTP